MHEGHQPLMLVGALHYQRLYYSASSKAGHYGQEMILHQILMRLTDKKWLTVDGMQQIEQMRFTKKNRVRAESDAQL